MISVANRLTGSLIFSNNQSKLKILNLTNQIYYVKKTSNNLKIPTKNLYNPRFNSTVSSSSNESINSKNQNLIHDENFKLVMRQLAYPVVIVTVEDLKQSGQQHGSTISSFTPIAIKPNPIISISIQLPSRLAYSLSNQQKQENHFTIHLLNYNEESIYLAQLFSKPKDQFDAKIFSKLDKISAIKLNCKVINQIILPFNFNPSLVDYSNSLGYSTLFIASVLNFSSNYQLKPLLYYNQNYTSVKKSQV